MSIELSVRREDRCSAFVIPVEMNHCLLLGSKAMLSDIFGTEELMIVIVGHEEQPVCPSCSMNV